MHADVAVALYMFGQRLFIDEFIGEDDDVQVQGQGETGSGRPFLIAHIHGVRMT